MLSGILYRITTEAADQPFCILVAAAVLTAGDYNGIRPYDLTGFFTALHGRSVSVSCHRITSLLMFIYILLTKRTLDALDLFAIWLEQVVEIILVKRDKTIKF